MLQVLQVPPFFKKNLQVASTPFFKKHRLKWISLDTNGKTGQVGMTSNGPQASLL